MHLFEAIIEANHRAIAGDTAAGIRPADFADVLPVVGLICIDPRLDPLVPEVMGLLEDQFLCVRNPGNIVTSSTSSTVRSLALACAIKHAGEVVILGHTDCAVRKTSVLELTERFRALGIDRTRLPDNLTEYFGLFASERQNVIRAVELVRASPLISPKIPVHGLLVDIDTGRLEWVVNGYQTLPPAPAAAPQFQPTVVEVPIGELGRQAEQPAAQPAAAGAAAGESLPGAAPGSGAPRPSASKPPPIPPRGQPLVRLYQPWKKRP